MNIPLKKASIAVDRSPAFVYLSKLGHHGQRTMGANLERLAELASGDTCGSWTCPWWKITYADALALREALCDGYAPATVNHHLSALRGVLAASHGLGLMSDDEYLSAVAVENV